MLHELVQTFWLVGKVLCPKLVFWHFMFKKQVPLVPSCFFFLLSMSDKGCMTHYGGPTGTGDPNFWEQWPLYAAWGLSSSMSLSLQPLASCVTAVMSYALAPGLNGSFLFCKHLLCSNCHSCWNKAIYRDAPNYHLLFFFLSKIRSYLI